MCEHISEQRRQYTKKALDTSIKRNPSIKCNDLKFLREYENKNLRLAPKPLHAFKSVYKEDFGAAAGVQEQPEDLRKTQKERFSEHPELLEIDRTIPSYAKYLDTSATSYGLDYLPFSYDQLRGIAAHDNITFWTWNKDETKKKLSVWPIKQNYSANLAKNRIPRPKGEFQILQNYVPNRGLTSESKSNYGIPDRSLDYDMKCIIGQLD